MSEKFMKREKFYELKLTPTYTDHIGVGVTYTTKDKLVEINGWYDSCVGFDVPPVSLADFLKGLGITLADCEAVLKENER